MLTDAARRREAARVVHMGVSEPMETKVEAKLVARDVREEGEPCEIRSYPEGWRVLLSPTTDPAA